MDQNTEIFIDYLANFYGNLQGQNLENIVEDTSKTAVLSIDVINTFCRSGILASDRVAKIIHPVVDFFNLAWVIGIRHFVLLQDCHTTHAEEFEAFGKHAICGTEEAETVDELKSLPFFNEMRIITKNSINPGMSKEFNRWLDDHSEISTYIVVGDCTDLCVYQLAMNLKTYANARGIHRSVIIPENCVNTYDISVEAAENSPAEPHPGDLLHKLFLHHMYLNGIEIYKKLV